MHNLIPFIESLNIDETLFKTIMEGYDIIFTESFNAWSPNVQPITPPMGMINRPKSDGVFNPLQPAGVSGSGEAGSANGTGYVYEPAQSEQLQRNIGEETKESVWNAPQFKKYVSTPNRSVKELMDTANSHIPTGVENMYALNSSGSMISGGLYTANFPAYDNNLIQGGYVGGSSNGGSASTGK